MNLRNPELALGSNTVQLGLYQWEIVEDAAIALGQSWSTVQEGTGTQIGCSFAMFSQNVCVYIYIHTCIRTLYCIALPCITLQ